MTGLFGVFLRGNTMTVATNHSMSVTSVRVVILRIFDFWLLAFEHLAVLRDAVTVSMRHVAVRIDVLLCGSCMQVRRLLREINAIDLLHAR